MKKLYLCLFVFLSLLFEGDNVSAQVCSDTPTWYNTPFGANCDTWCPNNLGPECGVGCCNCPNGTPFTAGLYCFFPGSGCFKGGNPTCGAAGPFTSCMAPYTNQQCCCSSLIYNKCYIFASSVSYPSNLGGLAGADTICTNLATAAGWVGGNTWNAWLSDSTTDAANRVPHSALGYFLPDETKIADDWTDLTDGNIDNPININESGGIPPTPDVWTGTDSAGFTTWGLPGDDSCNNWWPGGTGAAIGQTIWTNGAWTYLIILGCGGNKDLYCISCDSMPTVDCDTDQPTCDLAVCRDNLCNGGSCWNVGGEIGNCCEDPADVGSEFYWFYDQFDANGCNDITNPGCVGRNDDLSDNACCNNDLDCVYNNTCYSNASLADIDGDGVAGEICTGVVGPPDDGKWKDADLVAADCTMIGGFSWLQGGELVQFGEYDAGNSIECCGDDVDEVLVSAGPGPDRCCSIASGHNWVDAGGNCVVPCVDADGDGFDTCDPADPGDTDGKKKDCCDAGTEPAIGCSVANAPNIHPEALEICGNGIDDDCNGTDLSPCLELNNCCTLEHDLTEIDPACASGNTVAEKDCLTDECWCDYDGNGYNDAGPSFPSATRKITKNWQTCCIIDTIYNVTDWVFYVLLGGAAVIVIIAGYFFFTAGGNPSKTRTAQIFLRYGIAGLALALMSKIIPAIIKAIVS